LPLITRRPLTLLDGSVCSCPDPLRTTRLCLADYWGRFVPAEHIARCGVRRGDGLSSPFPSLGFCLSMSRQQLSGTVSKAPCLSFFWLIKKAPPPSRISLIPPSPFASSLLMLCLVMTLRSSATITHELSDFGRNHRSSALFATCPLHSWISVKHAFSSRLENRSGPVSARTWCSGRSPLRVLLYLQKSMPEKSFALDRVLCLLVVAF